MSGLIDYLFGAASFMPHGYCLLWRPDLVAMHGVADALTAMAYFSIPAVIHIFMRRRADFDYGWLAWLFIAFIGACGLTHAIGLATLWQPIYGLEGLVKLATAAVSVTTAFLMWPLLPKALAVPSPAQLREANEGLKAQVLQRQQAETELRQLHADLERRVDERTRELEVANEELARINQDRQRALLRLQAIMDNTVDGLITVDETGDIQDYNPACEQIFGYAADEAIGRNVDMLMTSADAVDHRDHMERYRRTGEAGIIGVGREVEGRRKDGTIVPLDLSISEIRVGDEHVFSGVLRDVTERKRIEVERETLVERLRISNKELEQFAYVASHDLRAPLRALSILPKWISRDLERASGVPSAIDEHLTDMKIQVDRMDRLLADLLEYSRVGKATRNAQTIDAAAVVQDVRDLLQPPPDFEIVVDGELPAAEANPTEFELVMRNLIANAIKHHDRSAGRISVRGGHDGDIPFFEVRDDGPGIPPAYHQRIFQMFSTLRSRDEVEGSGMGLALIKKIVEGWGGRITVLSGRQERGATFQFTVPRPGRAAA